MMTRLITRQKWRGPACQDARHKPDKSSSI